MKRILIIPLLIITLLVCSCQNVSKPQNDDITYGAPDTNGINTVMLNTAYGMVPISLCKDGRGMLADECYYYDLCNVIEAEQIVKQKNFTGFDAYGKNIGAVDCNNPNSKPYEMLATSGNWRLCPDVKSQGAKQINKKSGYDEFIKESFPENFGQNPATVTDIWEYDIDLDGTNEAIVRAKDSGYNILVLLSQSLGNTVLASDFEDESYVCTPYFIDTDGNGTYALCVLKGGKLKTFNVYSDTTVKPMYTVYLPLGA